VRQKNCRKEKVTAKKCGKKVRQENRGRKSAEKEKVWQENRGRKSAAENVVGKVRRKTVVEKSVAGKVRR
jgi:hypothetical protein